MKISLNTIRSINQKYGCAGEPAPDGVDKLVERLGAQLGAIEEVVPIGKKYEQALVVRIEGCEKHPNADRLHVCVIDDGGLLSDVERLENGLVQVVCGAPNVRAGMSVVWLPPGATVPSTFDNDPFVLEARELRGVVSNGMLASPKELALGDSHEGILEIDEDIAPGTSFAEYYGLRGDVIIDIENKMFTHRPDCFGWLGVAREIAGIQGEVFRSPEWYRTDVNIPGPTESLLRVEVRNEIPDLVPRFLAVPMADVTVGPSPVWLQARLSRVGLRPINNIVDLTNLYMLETGQPLHAYDYDKVVARDPNAGYATIVIRKPQSGEQLTLLNGKVVEPREDSIVIASASGAIGLGGVMGGADTEVDEQTKNIILECATFDMYSIRRTSMAHGIFSDAVTRFNKGQSPLQNRAVMAKIVADVERVAGGRVGGPIVDDIHLPREVLERQSLYPDVNVEVAFINQRLGLDLSADDMRRLLQNVEFDVELVSRTMVDETDGTKVETDTLTVRAPFWRTDIEIPEDVVEEVGRLYGFDKLPLALPRRDLTPARRNPQLDIMSAVRRILRQAGANELLTYSFVHERLLQKAGQQPQSAYQLSNALSPDLQYYRLSLMPSLLDKVQPNIKAGHDAFALFELGRAHIKGRMDDEGLPEEFCRLAFVFAANDKAAGAYSGASYYQARLYLQQVLDGFALKGNTAVSYRPLQDFETADSVFEQLTAPFQPQRSVVIMLGEAPVGVVGEYRTVVTKAMKLPVFSAGFEIDTSILAGAAPSKYRAVPRFPKVEQDICLRVPADTAYDTLYSLLLDALQLAQPSHIVSKLAPLDIYQRQDDAAHKQVTLRYSVASYERTLTDAEVSKLLTEAAGRVAERLHGEII